MEQGIVGLEKRRFLLRHQRIRAAGEYIAPARAFFPFIHRFCLAMNIAAA